MHTLDISKLQSLTKSEIIQTIKPEIISLFNQLNAYYVSPLSKLSVDIEIIKHQLKVKQTVIRIEDPASWLTIMPSSKQQLLNKNRTNHDQTNSDLANLQQGNKSNTQDNNAQHIIDSFQWLQHLVNYLQNKNLDLTQANTQPSARSVFQNDYLLKLKLSLPYFEWNISQNLTTERAAISDYLGNKVAIIFLKSNNYNDIAPLLKSFLINFLDSKNADTKLWHYLIIYEASCAAIVQNDFEAINTQTTQNHTYQFIQDEAPQNLIANNILKRFESTYHSEKSMLSVFKSNMPTIFLADQNLQLNHAFGKSDLSKAHELILNQAIKS